MIFEFSAELEHFQEDSKGPLPLPEEKLQPLVSRVHPFALRKGNADCWRWFTSFEGHLINNSVPRVQ